MANDLGQMVIGGAAILISLLTFVLSTNDRRAARDRERIIEENKELRKENDLLKHDLEEANKRINDYAFENFQLRAEIRRLGG